MTTSPQRSCDICNKATGIYDCRGCQRSFCRKHVVEHNIELSKEMDNVVYHHDLLRQQLTEQDTTSNEHSLIKEINDWECESIEKIKNQAEKARREFNQLFTSNNRFLTKQLEAISSQLQTSKEADDYSEKALADWSNSLEKLRKELSAPTNLTLQRVNDGTWLQRCEIMNVPLITTDKFDKVCGNVTILEDGIVAEHRNGASAHAAVRGFATYSTGIHNIRLKIEKMVKNYWMFWGIISQHTQMQSNSYSSTSAYGWAKNPNQTYLSGVNNPGYNNYDADIVENDVLQLILNCNDRTINLESERTKKKYTIPIDLNRCPFPWQLHINFHSPNDCIRILECIHE